MITADEYSSFEQSAYRDMRPDSIFVEFTNTNPVAQLFNFDCTNRLKAERRKVFFTQFEERLNEEINHPLFGYSVT